MKKGSSIHPKPPTVAEESELEQTHDKQSHEVVSPLPRDSSQIMKGLVRENSNAKEMFQKYSSQALKLGTSMQKHSSHGSQKKTASGHVRSKKFEGGNEGWERSLRLCYCTYGIIMYHFVFVPFRIGFLVTWEFQKSFLWWIVVEAVFLDSVTAYVFMKEYRSDVKRRRSLRGKAGKFYSVLGRVVRFIAMTPVIETVVFMTYGPFSGKLDFGFKFWCYFRLMKLLQVFQLRKVRERVMVALKDASPRSFNRQAIRYGEFFGLGLLLAHIYGCCWNGFGFRTSMIENTCQGSFEEETSTKPHGWLFSDTMKCIGLANVSEWPDRGWKSCGPCSDSVTQIYLRSLYWALTTVAAVGYGDITPTTINETLFAMVAQVSAIVLNILLLASITSLISNADAARLAFNRRFTLVRSFLKVKDVSKSVQAATSTYFDTLWAKHEGYEDSVLLQNLPESLSTSIKFSIFSNVLFKSKTFQGCPPDFLQRMVSNAHVIMYLHNEKIFSAGNKANVLYGVFAGTVKLDRIDVAKEKKTTFEAMEGSLIGHVEVLLEKNYLCNAYASKEDVHGHQSFVEVFAIQQENLALLALQYVETWQALKQVAQELYDFTSWKNLYTLRSEKAYKNGAQRRPSKRKIELEDDVTRERRRSNSIVFTAVQPKTDSVLFQQIQAVSKSESVAAATSKIQAQTDSVLFQQIQKNKAAATATVGTSLTEEKSAAQQQEQEHGFQPKLAFGRSASRAALEAAPEGKHRSSLQLNGTPLSTRGAKLISSGPVNSKSSSFGRTSDFFEQGHSRNDSWGFVLWQSFTVIGTLCYVLFIPVRLVFISENDIPKTFPFAVVLDGFFWLDLVFRGISARKLNWRDVPRTYKVLLFFDAFTLLPFEIVPLISLDWVRWSRFRLTRVFKVLRLHYYAINVEEVIERKMQSRIEILFKFSARLLVLFLVVSSWMICFWAGLGSEPALVNGYGTWSALDWEVTSSCGHTQTSVECAKERQGSFDMFFRATYWAMATMTTTGYGDIVASSPFETGVAVVSIAIASLLLYPAILANISVMQGGPSDSGCISTSTKPLEVMIEQTRGCSALMSLPDGLRDDLKGYLENVSAQAFNAQEILNNLPPYLAQKVSFSLYGKIVTGESPQDELSNGVASPSYPNTLPKLTRNIGALNNCSSGFIEELCYHLAPEIVPVSKIALHRLEVPLTASFIVSGKMELLECQFDHLETNEAKLQRRGSVNGFTCAGELGPGKYFGLLEMTISKSSSYTVRASEQTTILTISQKSLWKLFDKYVEDYNELFSIADKYLNPTANRESAMKSMKKRKSTAVAARVSARRTGTRRVSAFGAQGNGGLNSKFLIFPDEKARHVFDLVFMVVDLQIHLLIPMGIGTITNAHCSVDETYWVIVYIIVNLGCDVVSFCEIFMKAFVFARIDDNDQVIARRSEIFKGYVKSREFLIDFLSAFPFDWIAFLAMGGSSSILYISYWFRLIKVIKLLNLRTYIDKLQLIVVDRWKVKGNSVKLMNLFLLLCVFAHWLACFWMRFVNATHADDHAGEDVDSWGDRDCVLSRTCFNQSFYDGMMPYHYEHENLETLLHDETCAKYEIMEAYVRAIYWVLVTLNTVGLGDIVPVTIGETQFTLIVIVLGAVMYALLIASLASVVANLDQTATTFKQLQEEMRIFVAQNKLPQFLRDKITSYMDQMWTNQRGGNLEQVMEFLPPTLRFEVTSEWEQGQLNKHPLFETVPEGFVISLLRRSHPMTFSPGDTIFSANQPAKSIYILVSGNVCLLAADGVTTVSKHSDKGVFGVEEFYDESLLHTSLQTFGFSNFLLIDRRDFDEALKTFPNIHQTLERNAVKMKNNSEVLKLAGNLKNRKVTKMMAIEQEMTGKSDNNGIPPGKHWRDVWEAFIFVVTLYVTLSVPFRIGMFGNSSIYDLDSKPYLWLWIIFDILCVNVFFTIDMYFHYKKFSFFQEGALISSVSAIKENYKKHWLKHDAIATIPIDLIVLMLPIGAIKFQLWSWLRLATVWRSQRIEAYYLPVFEYHLHEHGVQISAGLNRILRKLGMTIIIIHWTACAWFALTSLDGVEKSWAFSQDVEGVGRSYLRSLYFALTLISAVGYGDLAPKTIFETVFAILILLKNLFLIVDLIASVSTYISNGDSSVSRQETLRSSVMHMLEHRNVDADTIGKVELFLESQTLLARGIHQERLLKFLPRSIRSEISCHLHFRHLKTHLLFQDAPKQMISEICIHMKSSILVPGDMLHCQGNQTLELNLLHKGEMLMFDSFSNDDAQNTITGKIQEEEEEAEGDSRSASMGTTALERSNTPPDLFHKSGSMKEQRSFKVGSVVPIQEVVVRGKKIFPGNLVGIEMLLEVPNLKTCVALTVCELYYLTRENYVQILESYPEQIAEIQTKAWKCLDAIYLEEGFEQIQM